MFQIFQYSNFSIFQIFRYSRDLDSDCDISMFQISNIPNISIFQIFQHSKYFNIPNIPTFQIFQYSKYSDIPETLIVVAIFQLGISAWLPLNRVTDNLGKCNLHKIKMQKASGVIFYEDVNSPFALCPPVDLPRSSSFPHWASFLLSWFNLCYFWFQQHCPTKLLFNKVHLESRGVTGRWCGSVGQGR